LLEFTEAPGGENWVLFSVLGLGFLIGLHHAFEADHIAAVSSIASASKGLKSISRQGLFWGIGHASMLFVIAGAALVLQLSLSDRLASGLEFAVGMMLIGLGAQLLYRLWRDRVHFHTHEHGDGTVHFHAHSHKGEAGPHQAISHDHQHGEPLPWRSLAVGLMHGMAGSAALVVLASTAATSPLWGITYIVVFGLGSIAGMVVLSAIIAVPISYTAASLTWANHSLRFAIGLGTIAIGAMISHGASGEFLTGF